MNAPSRTTRLLLVVIMTAALAACGTGRREIQQDGTGTDEMLKSPCTCLPVPYEAPGFEWVS